MQISYLADHPQFIATLAPWVCEHWRPMVSDETLQTRIAKLQSHLHRHSLPVALVAHAGNQVYGTAALRMHDLPGKQELSPWLGGVFVGKPFRGKGVGAALCAGIEELARVHFGVSTLYLFTLDLQPWYQALGWSVHETSSWCGRDGAIMSKRISG